MLPCAVRGCAVPVPPNSFRAYHPVDHGSLTLEFSCGDNFAVTRWLSAFEKISSVCANPRAEGNGDSEAVRKLGTPFRCNHCV